MDQPHRLGRWEAMGWRCNRLSPAWPRKIFADVCAIIWPWNETDSLRLYSEYDTFETAALRFLALLRAMVEDTSNKIPLVWWNAIPYGSADGITMHRQVVQSIASSQSQNVVSATPRRATAILAGPLGSYDGIATGERSERIGTARTNLRFAMLAARVVAQALVAEGYAEFNHGCSRRFAPGGRPLLYMCIDAIESRHSFSPSCTTAAMT